MCFDGWPPPLRLYLTDMHEIQPPFKVDRKSHPWNRFSKPHNEPSFEPHEKLLGLKKNEWEDISGELFKEVFKSSAVKRTKYLGLKRNLEFLKG